jgi:hypothetical protein
MWIMYKVEMSSDKLKNLGWQAKTLEETLAYSVESFEKSMQMGNLARFRISTVCHLSRSEWTLWLTCYGSTVKLKLHKMCFAKNMDTQMKHANVSMSVF